MLDALFVASIARNSGSREAMQAGHDASRAATQIRTQNESIEVDIEKLYLITQALWTLLKEKHGYTDETLIAKVAEIDLLDGQLDGKLTRDKESRPDCQKCGRKLMARRNVCMYCGERHAVDPFNR